MPNEHFCLKWNNFQRNIVAALGNLKLDEDFVDVTISCEGKLIKAHKVILSACSDYFRDLFRENPCQHPVIILRDASYTDVEGLVRYVYRGEVDVQPQHLQSFLKTADALKIKGLADQGLVQDQAQPQEKPLSPPLESPEEESASSAFEPYTPPASTKIQEPLRIPTFRSNCSSSSSDEPDVKRMRGSVTPPLNLMLNPDAVPLVKRPEDSQEPTAYPPPSQSPLFLPSPKHISKIETGSIDDETFPIERKPPKLSTKKKKLKKEEEEMNENDNNNDGGGTNNSTHPRNRWRCMQPRLCNYCWKTFSNSFNLKQHIVNVHIQSQGVSCSLCDKVVKNKWYLRKHLVTAHGAPLKRVNNSTSAKKEHEELENKTNDDQPNANRLSTTC